MLTALLWIALLAPTPADVDKARELFQIGGEAYRKGRYTVAISAFEEARRLVDQPAVVFSLGQAARLQYFLDGKIDNLRTAVDAYRSYLDTAPTGRRRDHAAEHLAALVPVLERARLESAERRAARRATVARLIISSTVDGATASIDGAAPQPIPATFEVKPGARVIEVRAPEHLPSKTTSTAVAGAALPVQIELTPLPGTLTVTTNVADTIRLDDRSLGPKALTAPIELPPGSHRLVLTARGHQPFVRSFTLERKQALSIDAQLPRTGQRVAAWSLLGAGAATLLVSGTFGVLALNAQSDAQALESDLDSTGLDEDGFARYRSLESDRDGHANVALTLGIAGVAAIASGVLLWIFDHEQPANTF